MGLVLSASDNIFCRTEPGLCGMGISHGGISIGEYNIDTEDFCDLVKYVLTNTDIAEFDERKDLVNYVRSLKKVPGYISGHKRFGTVG